MARQFNVLGPSLVSVNSGSGYEEVGETNGEVLIVIREIHRADPITTDEYGGDPADYIQRSSRAQVAIVFQKYDRVILTKMRMALVTPATPAIATIEGSSQAPGLLMRADQPSSVAVRIAGTRETITFADVIRDPETDLAFENIGSKAETASIGLLAFPASGAGNQAIYTRAATD